MNKVFGFVDATRKRFWEEKAREIAALVDPKTNKVYEHLTTEVDCPICEVNDASFVFSKEGFQFVKCKRCGLLYANPQLKPEISEKFYLESKTYEHFMQVQLGEKEQAWNATVKYHPALDLLDRLAPRKGRLLDVGCGVGQFMRLARDRGWEVEGIELNRKEAQYTIDTFGFKVETRSLGEVGYRKEHFDLIALWGVLEHLTDPRATLEEIHPLLKPDGHLLVFVPNGHSLVVRVMREYNSTISGRAHLWYFSPRTLGRFLEKAQFALVHQFTVLPQLHEILHHLQYNRPYREPETLCEEEFVLPTDLRRNVETYINDNLMGFKLIAIARKA